MDESATSRLAKHFQPHRTGGARLASTAISPTSRTTGWPPPKSRKKKPRNRIAGQRRIPRAEPKLPPLGGERADWPASLAGLREWWLAEPSLDCAGNGPRIAPRGAADARLMVLVPMPEAEDRDSLLSGPQGKLVAAMLSAMGIAGDEAYLASALPCHAPHADWEMLADPRLRRDPASPHRAGRSRAHPRARPQDTAASGARSNARECNSSPYRA